MVPAAPDDRGDAALRKAHALARTQHQEARAAQQLLHEFVKAATAAGLVPQVLTARSYDGATRYRTNVRGWYLKRDRSVGVGTDGEFYILSAPRSLRSRFRGAILEPSAARLELGRGGRDGESIPLKDALARLLAETSS